MRIPPRVPFAHALILAVLILAAAPAAAVLGNLVFDPPTRAIEAAPGDPFTTTYTLRNDRPASENIDITVTTSANWTIEVSPDNLTLAAGDTATLRVSGTMPASSVAGNEFLATIRASTTGTDPTSATANLTGRVRAPTPTDTPTTSPPAEEEATPDANSTTEKTPDNQSFLDPGTGGHPVLRPLDAPVAAWSVGAVLIGVAAWLSADGYARVRLLLLWQGLYARLSRDQLLDHASRSRIYASILQNPGISYGALRRALELNHGTLSHHLWVLQRERMILAARDGVRARFFPPGFRLTPGAPLSEVQRAILDRIAARPGISQRDLAAQLSLSKQVVNYHVRSLAKDGRVRVEREGRETRLRPGGDSQ